MYSGQVDILLGGDCMALYKDGDLKVAATKLTFADVLEALGIGCDITEVDLELYDNPEKFPFKLNDIREYEEPKGV